MTDASTPITSASTTIEVSTWRRLAPSVRSVASSRVRCAIVIESEFAITKLPTKSAMPPKASRKPRRNEMNEFVCFASSRAWAVPEPHLCSRRQDRAHLLQDLLRRDGRLRSDRDLIDPPLLVEQTSARLASRSPQASRRRAARPSRTGRSRRSAASEPGLQPGRRSCRPTAKCFFFATFVSITISLPCRPGARDELQRIERRVAVLDAEAEVGRAAEDDRLVLAVDELRRFALHAAVSERDVGKRPHLGDDRLRDRRRKGALSLGDVERRLAR